MGAEDRTTASAPQPPEAINVRILMQWVGDDSGSAIAETALLLVLLLLAVFVSFQSTGLTVSELVRQGGAIFAQP